MDQIIVLPVPPAAPAPYLWLMDVGAYFDRFGPLKYVILMDADPFLQAVMKDLQSRHWIDLQDPQVATALAYMMGTAIPGIGTIATPIPGLTQAIVTAVLSTLPAAQEQLALVKLYFS
jgi:hypothetical protein